MKSDDAVKLKKDDLLDRYVFAENIVTELKRSFNNGQGCVVYGINDEWGSGKSSFMNFLKEEIEIQYKDEQTRNIVFDFNPWMYNGHGELAMSFLTQLGIKLRSINPELKKIAEDFLFALQLTSIANSANPNLISKGLFGAGININGILQD